MHNSVWKSVKSPFKAFMHLYRSLENILNYAFMV